MSQIWQSIQGVFARGLELLHEAFVAVGLGDASWGWAIIALTLIVRIGMLPLARKQFTSMRAMQELSPQVKKIQKKYKTDRDLMKKDPERYRTMKSKQNEELQALYREHGVNPASGCLPLLAQAPIFLALFSVLRSRDILDGEIVTAPFYFFTENAAAVDGFAVPGLGSTATSAGWPGWLLILLMSGTMFFTQRQTMARTQAARADRSDDDGPDMAAQQQKILMYVMPVFLAFISRSFPLGVLLYWVTTNIWQVAQQALILREVKDTAPGTGSSAPAKGASKPAEKKQSLTGRVKDAVQDKVDDSRPATSKDSRPSKKDDASSKKTRSSGKRSSHLPSRKTS